MLSHLPPKMVGQISNPGKLALEPRLLNTSVNTAASQGRCAGPSKGVDSQAQPSPLLGAGAPSSGNKQLYAQVSVLGEPHRALRAGTPVLCQCASPTSAQRQSSASPSALHQPYVSSTSVLRQRWAWRRPRTPRGVWSGGRAAQSTVLASRK